MCEAGGGEVYALIHVVGAFYYSQTTELTPCLQNGGTLE